MYSYLIWKRSVQKFFFLRFFLFFLLFFAPNSYVNLKKKFRSMSIFVGKLLFFLLKKRRKTSPEGYSHKERKIFFSLCTPSHSYQSIKKKSKSIPTTVLKFWVGTRFVTPTTTPTPTPTNDAAEDHNTLSGQSPSG